MKGRLERKIVVCQERMAPWRKDYSKEALEKIARQEPLPLAMVRQHYSQANTVLLDRLSGQKLVQPVNEKGRWNFDIGMKQCTDARQVTIDLDTLLKFLVIHERTAGNVVRRGMVFKSLTDHGLGIVEGHYKCGATGVAYQLRDATVPEIDEYILRILTSVSPYVRQIENAGRRDRENAVDQAWRARRMVKLEGREINVCAGFYTWENGLEGPNYEWLDHSAPGRIIYPIFVDGAKRMTSYALAEGRDLDSQYAAITMIYDPFRLGRINDPRVILDALSNEMFCVTFDLRRMEDDKVRPLSRTGMGSVNYANFDNGGHVAGVGGEDGTHALGIMDPDENVLDRVKRYLLDNFPAIKEMTQNGKAILPIRYDPETARAEFL